MSKVSFSRELLGTIKFVFDKTKSRTLNATQAYDKSPSQIVLASYPATSTIKGPTKSLGKADFSSGIVAVNARDSWFGAESGFGLKSPEDQGGQLNSVTVSWGGAYMYYQAKKTTVFHADTALFHGAWYATGPVSAKSNATKEIFAGNITVGTGLYRDWQNKYAVLKVDLLTNKAILRVYNE